MCWRLAVAVVALALSRLAAAGEEPLAGARSVLGSASADGRLGPFRLLSDVGSRRQLRRLDRIATALPAAYGARFGLEPSNLDESWVVVFSSREDYARFAGGLVATADRPLAGHALPGLAALPEGRGPEETVQLLVHELAHLLNRAAGLPALPAWLEEGMANDLAFSKVDSGGRLALGTLAGSSYMSEGRLPVVVFERNSGMASRTHPPEAQTWGNEMFHYSGPLASLKELVAAVGARQATPLATLLALSPADFARGEGFGERYAQSALFVRFLLDESDPSRAGRFRDYLAWSAAGRPATAEELARTLDNTIPELEPEFHTWLMMQAEGL